MVTQEMIQLIEAYGWLSIPSKNPFMISFTDEEDTERMNVYFTTGTITIQSNDKPIKTWKGIQNITQLETILML